MWLLLVSAPAALRAQTFELRFERLAAALAMIEDDDRTVVDQAVDLIRRGEHNLALVRLSGLNEKNPQNSSLRILTAYATLRLGDLLGAFEQAQVAEKAPDHNSYSCWFLAKIALLKGDKDACRRELKHLKGAKDMRAEVAELEKELKQK
jgi:Flp pilus assembly protein TadD